jgi:hypothetical protein
LRPFRPAASTITVIWMTPVPSGRFPHRSVLARAVRVARRPGAATGRWIGSVGERSGPRFPGLSVVLAAMAVLSGACGGAAVIAVEDGSYLVLVPSMEQFEADLAGDLPGGLRALGDAGVSEVRVDIVGDRVTLALDGREAVTRTIVERVQVTDAEGSVPFRAKKELLVLGDVGLRLGSSVIDEPVIWPGSFAESPIITVKPRNVDERGPAVSCTAAESCLILTSGVDPTGSYADANNPELDENPLASIAIDETSVEFTLDDGDRLTVTDAEGPPCRACGLAETWTWNVPPELVPAVDDPVLVRTLCPSTTGGAIQLIVMERTDIPQLAPLTEAREGDWCTPGPRCLLFVPT